ncbi:hypothetical protein [Paraburkholderia strydomiana]|uniref:hypothetical protein n=1 Tax=Paraburkholderia strydomiana TaxID=1245417 RepID=UPI0038B94DD3
MLDQVRRKIAKFMTLFVAVLIGGHGLSGFADIENGQLLSGLLTLSFTAGVLWFLVRRYRTIRRYENETYEWYVRQHPVRDGTKPSCATCGANFLQTRRLMRYTYTREHFCGACGTGLYYSDER